MLYYWLWTILCLLVPLVLAFAFYKHVYPTLKYVSYRNRTLKYAPRELSVNSNPHLLSKWQLVFEVSGTSVWISAGKLFVRFRWIGIWYCPKPSLGAPTVVKKGRSKWLKENLKSIVKPVVQFIGQRIVIEVEEGFRIMVSSMADNSNVDKLFYLQLQVGRIWMSWEDPKVPLSIDGIMLKECCSHAVDTVDCTNVVNIDELRIERTEFEMILQVGKHIDIDISITLLMLIGSLLDRMPKPPTTTEKSEVVRLPLPDINITLSSIDTLAIAIHLPVTQPEFACLDSAQLILSKIKGEVSISDLVPFFCLNIGRILLLGKYLEVRAEQTVSIGDRLLSNTDHDLEVKLLVIEELTVSDYGQADNGCGSIEEWLGEMRDGRGPWWWNLRPWNHSSDGSVDHKDLVNASRKRAALIKSMSKALQTDVDRSLLNADGSVHIFLNMLSIKFFLPPEFPIGNMFDHIVYMYKAAFKGDRWDVISSAGNDFLIRIGAETAEVSLGDDEFDVAMGRLFECKSLFSKSHHSASTEEQARFEAYKSICDVHSDSIRECNLLTLACQDLVLAFQWKQTWSGPDQKNKGMVKLLTGIAQEETLSAKLLEEMDTLLGGWAEMSAKEVSLGLRDYALPLLSAPMLRVSGLVFLLELLPNTEAVLKLPMSVYPCADSSNLTRALRGDSFVLKNTNPLKVFHCIHALSHGPKLTRLAFSPRWLPSFEQVNRSMETLSSPSPDPSPVLPIWDKLRFLIRGRYSCLTVDTPCHFELLLCDDLRSVEERLAIILPEGTLLEQGPRGSLDWIINSGSIVAFSSNDLSLLQYHLAHSGRAFTEHDKHSNQWLGENAVYLGDLPKCRLTAQIHFTTAGNEKCCDHFSVLTVCSSEDPLHDSFKKFRADSIKLDLKMAKLESVCELVTSPQAASSTTQMGLYYYRELEEWFIKSFARLIDVPCKKGTLWKTAFVPQHRPIDIPRYLKDITFHVKLEEQVLQARAVSFSSVEEYSGILVSAKGFNVHMHLRRHMGMYQALFGEWDIYNGLIQCFSSTVPGGTLLYPGIGGFELLKAPHIAYNAFNESLYSTGDGELFEMRIKKLLQKQPQAQEYIETRISFIKEALLRAKDCKPVTRCLYTAYSPNVWWHQEIRDVVYTIIFQQTVRQESAFAQSRKMEKMLADIVSFYSQKPTVSTSSESKQVAEAVGEVQFFEQLLSNQQPVYADPDTSSRSGRAKSKLLDLKGPLDLQDTFHVPKLTQVKLVNPRAVFVTPVDDKDTDACTAILMVVPEALLETSRVFEMDAGQEPDFDFSKPIGRRLRIKIGDAQLFVLNDYEHGSCYDAKEARSKRQVTDRISITVVYDATLPAATLNTPVYSPALGDSVRVHCPSFAVSTQSSDFSAILNTITRLLVFRDPQKAHRTEQKRALYKRAIEGKQAAQELAQEVFCLKKECEGLQELLFEALKQHNEEQEQSYMEQLEEKELELSVLTEALMATKSAQEKSIKQSRLLLELSIEEAVWTLLSAGDTAEGKVGVSMGKEMVEEKLAEAVLIGIYDEWLSDSDGSVGTLFEIASLSVDGQKRGLLVQPLEAFSVSPLVRFAFKTNPPKAIGGLHSVERAEIFLSPLLVHLSQSTATQLFHFFFPASQQPQAQSNAQQPHPTQHQQSNKKKEKINFTAISIPASKHLISFKADTRSSSSMDVSDFMLKLPDFEYSNEQCTWDELAIKVRNDAILVLLKNAGSLLKQKFTSKSASAEIVARSKEDAMRAFYKKEALPSIDEREERKEGGREERARQVEEEEKMKKGRFLFGRFYQ